ncbi:hypothetical protein ABHY64_004483 [Yersinia enterocolitica]|uniref:hypothetical protein n=1 Tax=Klebsiella pneumoniae TaxID=573 RepID=UPI0011E53CE9|nr:hypothetical protein [Klebsiella pneumoniae]EAQ1395161.1 hypothetical protein [Salmonella enterica]EDF6226443.1 hypothetical protein [Salmonella enterica subsp. enterica serovar Newport]EKN4845495.1 hypothetical protein [Yersinia enterocolitica]MDK6337006.1 hypothetical protein [Escherichia coli]EAV3540188.1 hypothetical protein [Salmonella enterica]
MKKMVNLFYAARGLWRMAVNFIREAVRSSLLAVMHMVSVHIPVLIFLAVFVLAVSGFGLLVIKVLAIMMHSGAQGPIAGSIANVLDALNQTFSPMVYFKIAVPVFCVVVVAALFGAVRFNRKEIAIKWRRLVEVGKYKR